MNKKVFSAILFLATIMVSFLASYPATGTASWSFSDDRLEKAASYLIGKYNSSLRLVANSEDEGPNPLGSEGVPCYSTYWIYSDNLWAGWALQPYSSISENILETVQNYTLRYGRSMLFEAAIGEPIPTTVHEERNIKVYDESVNGIRVQILLDRHQYADNPLGIFHDSEEYADLCFYMTINYWMMGDANASEHWFRTGEAMWNYSTGNGFYDKATVQDGCYQNFKLGLFILAQRVTEFQSDITEIVETAAWKYQNRLNGGITTQSWLDGSAYGTANAEATSALLLSYNSELTDRLHKRQTYAQYSLELIEAELERTRALWFTFLVFSTSLLGIASLVLAVRSMRITKRARANHNFKI